MKTIKAWVLWNEQRCQYFSDFHDTPKLFSSRDKAVGATPFDSDSMLNSLNCNIQR